MRFETIKTQKIFRGKAFDVRQDKIRTPDGRSVLLDIVDHRGAVTILPVDSQGDIWFIRQYRHAAGEMILELPAGVMEEGELPEATAAREIREEIGMAASEIHKIGEFYLAPGYSTEFMHVFLASGLYPDPLPGDVDEFIQIERMKISAAYKQSYLGTFRDAKTIAALHFARPTLIDWLSKPES